MSDAGEGLVDAEARLQEQMEEREQERRRRLGGTVKDPDIVRERESLRLARVELGQQLAVTQHPTRRKQIEAAMKEIDRRLKN